MECSLNLSLLLHKKRAFTRIYFVLWLILLSRDGCFGSSSIHAKKSTQLASGVEMPFYPRDDTSGLLRIPTPVRPLEDSKFRNRDDGRTLRRRKRKVISRGGHYIIRSKIGGSPWGSPRGSTGPFSNWRRERKHPSSGGWNLRDNLRISDKTFALDASGGSRYSSGTLRRYNVEKPKPRFRKRISRALKFEIAQFALRNGAKRTSERYESEVGRKLKERVIEKFARRYVKRNKRKRSRKS